jgi:3-phosphoshikimate 1-carboxyvinyltransferase
VVGTLPTMTPGATAGAGAAVPDPWPAPLAAGPLDAVVTVPGSKSLTNRYLLLAALAEAPTVLRAPLHSRDSRLMAQALRALGTEIRSVAAHGGPAEGGADLLVTPAPLRGPAEIDCGLAGTVMRFLPPVAALALGDSVLDGDPRAQERPMGPVITALRDLGVHVTEEGRPGHLPITVHGTGAVTGGEVGIDASASSQFVSGLLLAAPRFARGLTLRHTGGRLPSEPHIAMTVEVLRGRGVVVDDSVPGTWRVGPGPVAGGEVDVEPDLSNAGPFLAAALVSGGSVRVPGWPASTTQAGDLLRGILERMGARVELDEGGLLVTGTGVVHGLDVDLRDGGELAPTVAALAALADSPSRLRGIAHLRGHETDRIAALTTEIVRLGGDAEETEDGLVIRPAALHGATVHTYEDHRMATFAAVVGLRVPGVAVENVATTAKTLPDFPARWAEMVTSTRP